MQIRALRLLLLAVAGLLALQGAPGRAFSADLGAQAGERQRDDLRPAVAGTRSDGVAGVGGAPAPADPAAGREEEPRPGTGASPTRGQGLPGRLGGLPQLVLALGLALMLLWCFAALLLWRSVNRHVGRLRARAGGRIGAAPRTAAARAPARLSGLADSELALGRAFAELDAQRRENERLLEEARQSNRAKTLFLASMSHELRTPLNAIGGFAEIIEHELLGPVGVARYREYAELIGRSNRRMLELVENLLDASALELGTMALHPAPAELDRLVEETADEQRLEAQRRGLRLEAEAASGLVARVDAPKLCVLLANLLRNALAYTAAGGSVRLQVRATTAGEPEFLVADTGIGMDPARLEQLRRPFTRGLEDSYVAGEPGAGLGLSIVDRIAELHGARLVFDTAPGTGTRVVVTLPRDSVVVCRAPEAEA